MYVLKAESSPNNVFSQLHNNLNNGDTSKSQLEQLMHNEQMLGTENLLQGIVDSELLSLYKEFGNETGGLVLFMVS